MTGSGAGGALSRGNGPRETGTPRSGAGRGPTDPWRWLAATAAVAALAAVAVLRSDGGEPADPADDDGRRVRVQRGWPVMGTVLRVSSSAPDSAAARRALRSARSRVERTDSLMSTYRETSDLSRVNDASGSGRGVRVSGSTARVLAAALAWAEASGGAFDPTAGPLADAWGFHRGEPAMPAPARADSAARLVGWRTVEYDSARRIVRLPRAGMRLDFGAIAKGWALDRAASAMRAAGAAGGSVDLGGNVLVFGPPPREGDRWRLGIRHPRRDGRLIGVVALDSGSVATSGDAEQFFVHDGARYSHVMDPRTGRPARGVAQVTVIADRGIDADALATTLFVLGPGEGRAFLRSPFVRRRAPRATAVWLLDPGAGQAFGRADVVCAGPRAPDVELWIGDAGAGGEEGAAAGPRGAAAGPRETVASPDSSAGGCRLRPPPGDG